jgi:hypothetical protein
MSMDVIVGEIQQQTSDRHKLAYPADFHYLHPSLASSPRILHILTLVESPEKKGSESMSLKKKRIQ